MGNSTVQEVKVLEVVSPIDGTTLGQVDEAQTNDVESAVKIATAAQEQWASESPAQRRNVLLDVARIIEEHADDLAETEALNTGKPIKDTLREMHRGADCFKYYAGWVDHVIGETLPLGAENHVYTEREPMGTVLGIIPWNMPFAFAAKKIAPALAFGNACILKPAPETPLTAIELEKFITMAGAPAGLAQVLVGGAELGQALVASPAMDLIVFTGSVATGKIISKAATENLTPCVLELGGSNAQVVFDDCNVEAALDAVMIGGFGSTGQMCVAGSRIFVQESIYDDFVKELSERVSKLVAGDFRDAGVHMGPQTTAAQQQLTQQEVEAAKNESVNIGGQGTIHPKSVDSDGFFVRPTLFVDVPQESNLMKEEIFGPVVAVDSFTDEADALSKINNSAYGLVAGVWSNDISRAHRVARKIQAGTVWLNTFRVLNDRVPFGGVKDSGYGQENGSSAYENYTRVKSVWASLNVGQSYGFAFGSDT